MNRTFLHIIQFLAVIALCNSASAQELETTPTQQSDNSQSIPINPPRTSSLNQDEIRQALLELLSSNVQQGDNSINEAQDTLNTPIRSGVSDIGGQLEVIADKLPDLGKALTSTFARTINPDTGLTGWQIVFTLLVIVLAGLIAERVTTQKLLQRLYEFVEKNNKTTAIKFRFIFSRIGIQLIGLVVLGIVSFGLAFFFIEKNQYLDILVVQFLSSLIQFRIWLILLRSILSPRHVGLRPVNIDDTLAIQLFWWFGVFFAVIEFGDALFVFLPKAGLDQTFINILLIPYTLALNIILLSRIWVNRKKITAMFSSGNGETTEHRFAQNIFAQSWPYIFTAWLLLLWMTWLYKMFIGEPDQAKFVSISWWITLAFPAADRIFHGLIKNVSKIPWLHSPSYPSRCKRFVKLAQYGFRLLLVSIAIFTLSEAGGFRAGAMIEDTWVQMVLGRMVDVLVILVIAYVIWELLHALIERKLPQDEPDAIASLEGDAGGAGATRAETLFPLLRSFLIVIFITFLVLSILSSLGIAIAPLLAGAGIVGIAIGFGAQKLVQDVISGIFFLIDDAFRKGEYIELEGLKGTVEKISIRSMQLRHHLGAVQTVPYGEIKTVKNLSRDWVTMKLELRLAYDADIEKVRKIIKKVGQQMLEDEEMGPSFILPLKSQGVMRVEESALIVRMKFTTKPGEQWVIRREAYSRVRDALSDAGIHFAHREVRVRLPGDDDQTMLENKSNSPTTGESPFGDGTKIDKTKVLGEAAAAAAASVIAADALKQDKIDGGEDDM